MSGEKTVNQSTDESPGASGSPERPRRIAGNLADVAHDVIELMELQLKLFVSDARSVVWHAVLPLVLLVVATCVLLGIVPLLGFAIAETLAERTEWTRSECLYATAAVGVVFAAICGVVAGWRLRRGLHGFDSSFDELQQNVSWFKSSLRRGRS